MRAFLTVAAAFVVACSTPALADPPEGMLLVGNKGEDTLSLIDLKTGTEITRVPTGDMPHEIAISPDGKQAAVVAYGGSTIDIVDLASRVKLKTIDIAPNLRPHGLVWLKDGRLVATAEKSQTVVVIAADGSQRAIPTGAQGSHMVAIAPDGRHAYVANIQSGTVGVLDLVEGKKLRDIAVGGKPEGISLAKGGKELWVGDLGAPRLQVYDTANGAKLAELAIDPVAIRVATSPDGKTVATSNIAAGTISFVDVATRKVTRTIPVSGSGEAGQVTILFSADGTHLYAAETGHDKVAEIHVASGKVLRRIAAGKNGDGLAIAPAHKAH